MGCRVAKSGATAPAHDSEMGVRGNRDMAKAAKPRHVELELVDVASKQTLKKGANPGFLPRAGETPLGPQSWARYKVMTLEYFMDYPDDPDKSESQTSYFKIAIYAERER